MSEPLITVEHLYKVFGPRPEEAMALAGEGLSKAEVFEHTDSTIGVQDAGFTVHEGEIFVVMGLSGSGKSTLLRLLNRLVEPSAGHIRIEGRDIMSLSASELIRLRRHQMTMVFQSFALLPHLSVGDNVAFGMRVADVDRAERRTRTRQALEQVGLASNADSYPDELSGGMQQRVGLARALAMDPPVWLMDEAFSALDPLIRARMQEELLELQAGKPRTIIFISHDLDEAMRIGDRIAIMEGGRVLQVGTAEEILEDPADDYVRSFFGGVNVAHVYQAGDMASRTAVPVLARANLTNRELLRTLRRRGHNCACVVDARDHFRGMISRTSVEQALRRGEHEPEAAFVHAEAVSPRASFDDVLTQLLRDSAAIPVVGEDGALEGVISRKMLLQTLHPRAEESE